MIYKITVSALLVLILGAGVWTGYNAFNGDQKSPSSSERKAQFLKGGDFTLTQEGSSFSMSSLKGQVVVLYFGYTHCPDVCPTGLAVIRDAFNKLEDGQATLQGVFISLDPDRDNRSRLAEYVGFFHNRLIGVSGSTEELDALIKNYGVYYRKVAMENSALGYTVDHTANFFVVDEDGELVYVLDHTIDSDTLASTISSL